MFGRQAHLVIVNEDNTLCTAGAIGDRGDHAKRRTMPVVRTSLRCGIGLLGPGPQYSGAAGADTDQGLRRAAAGRCDRRLARDYGKLAAAGVRHCVHRLGAGAVAVKFCLLLYAA